MAAKKSSWARFPHDAKAYDFAGDKLKKAWPALHAGDAEPFPDDKRAAALIKAAGKAAPKGLDAAGLAEALQDAWRAFHRGDFQQAYEAGDALGPVGASVACKALGIHATYLVDDEAEQLKRYEQVGKLAEAAIAALPGEANSHYRFAFGMGRYSQGISVAKALAQGLGGKVKDSLEKAIALSPKHADARIALGAFHAEVIDKVGKLLGKTYGADAGASVKHFEQALKLNPGSAIAMVEYANGLVMLEGDKRMKEAEKLYAEAAECEPLDAMERLDVEMAKAELEE